MKPRTFVLTTALFATTTFAQQPKVATSATIISVSTPHAEVEAYWSPTRILSATNPVLTPKVGADGLPTAPPAAQDNTPQDRSKGAEPVSGPHSGLDKTIVPATYVENAAPLSSMPNAPLANSSYGAYFTTTRVFPDAATVAYPYITAGKLFFTDSRTGLNYVCSASVLRQRIVVTAGHCLANPSTNPAQRYFYSNFLFVPAYNNGSAPVGTWSPNFAGVTNEWYFSNGSVPNAQDVGMLVINDQGGRKISYYTGYLGYLTLALANNDVTMLGYPCNLDRCMKMEATFARTFANGGNNTYTYGSAMQGGASGGPWVQDFGVNPASNPALSLGNNYLVAVTSYGPVATSPLYLGASQLDSRFTTLLSLVCGSSTSGNCN